MCCDSDNVRFRWVACQINTLEACLDYPTLKVALDSLPDTLDKTYAQILRNIPHGYKKNALRLLQFLTFSERPLRIEEAVEVMAVDPEGNPAFDPQNRMPEPKEISHYYASLVTVIARPVRSAGIEVVTELQLAHFSVKQYLTSDRLDTDYLQYFHLAAAKASITKICLSYLLNLERNLSLPETRRAFPLAQYCARYWMDYAAEVENDDKTVLKMILDFFLSTEKHYTTCYRLYCPDQPWNDEPTYSYCTPALPLYYASFGGLKHTVVRLLERGVNINAEGHIYGSALQAASVRGHESIVRVLLENGADMDAYGGWYGNALQAASFKGHGSIVRLLTSMGTKTDIRSTKPVNLEARFDLRVDRRSLDASIEDSRAAVESIPPDHPDRFDQSINLVNLLGMRYERTAKIQDIHSAMKLALEVFKTLNPSENMGVVAVKLYSMLMGKWFEITGKIDDFNAAISGIERSLNLFKVGQPGHNECLAALGHWYGTRYTRIGATEDLNRAIEVIRTALASTPSDHVAFADRSISLGQWTGKQYERTGAMKDLNEAIDITRQILWTSHLDHPNRARWFDSLATWLARRYDERGNRRDLDQAIMLTDIALCATPFDHPARAGLLDNFGTWLGKQYECDGFTECLDRAIEVTCLAVDVTPLDHPARAARLRNHGTWLVHRAERNNSSIDFDRALDSYLKAWDCSSAPPSDRIRACMESSKILTSRSEWQKLSSLLEGAIKLLPSVGLRYLRPSDKERLLAEFSGLASIAAAVSLNADRSAYYALELLESGRGVIAGAFMEMQVDVSELAQQHPTLADAYMRLQRDLNSIENFEFLNPSRRQMERQIGTEQRLNKLIAQIRALPGLEKFLMPPTANEMMAAAVSGPIVVLNTSEHRCDAFLIQHNQIRIIKLHTLNLEDIRKYSTFEGTSHNMTVMHFKWLWDTIACPILDALGFNDPVSDDEWPHVWWIPTGLLTRLPIHAAGDYIEDSGNTVLDRVMSSYSSSVKSLVYGRRALPRNSSIQQTGQACLVGMSQTSGLPTLKFVEREIKIVRKMCQKLQIRAVLPPLLKKSVLEQLNTCTMFHFAGRGHSSPAGPSKSSLILQDWKEDPLTAGDLLDLRLHDNPPFLAYLGACLTGSNNVDKLIDEGIHIISACQLAGFRHVIGTLDHVEDGILCGVAAAFYEALARDGLTDQAVCRSLHRAIRMLRDHQLGRKDSQRRRMHTRDACLVSWEERVSKSSHRWAAFVHFGV